MQVFEFDNKAKFNRGRLLGNYIFTGCSERIGIFKGITCHRSMYIKDKSGEKEITAQDLGVKAFIYSMPFYNDYTHTQYWETDIIGTPEGMKEVNNG